MVKRLLTIFMLGGALSAGAQQLTNGTFDADWVDCHPWEKGSVISGTQGKQPQGWCMANVNGMGGLGATVVSSIGEGHDGSAKSAVMTNTPNPLSASQVVPGYMTLGTTWATAKANMAGVVTEGTADGGVFGGISFTKRPDAIHFFYKRAHNVNNTTKSPTNLTEAASVIAYAWKGTWTQANVPSNTSMGTPSKVTMTDRSNNILGKDCLTGGTITKTTDAELISQIEYYIEADAADWTELTIPFEYKNETATPEKFNIIFSANDIFADRSTMGAGNQLTVDDVELVYYHSLTALSYDDVSVEGFAETTYEYDMSETLYEEGKIAYTKKGVAATVKESYDEESAVLTITVTGDDAEATAYKVKFKVPEVPVEPVVVATDNYTEILYVDVTDINDGTVQKADPQMADVIVETLENGNINFVLKNFSLSDAMHVGNIKVADLEVVDDKFTFNGNIEIENGDDDEVMWVGPYLGEIPLNMSGSFEDDKVYVTIDIDMSETLEQTIYVSLGYEREPAVVDIDNYNEKLLINIADINDGTIQNADPQMADVIVETLENGNINFVLKNFSLSDAMHVGNIKVANLEVVDDKFTFNGNIEIENGDDDEVMWVGPYLGEIPLDMTGSFEDDKVYVTIDIDMSETLEQFINVHLGYEAATMTVNSDAQYGTFCAPFEVEVPVGVEASTATLDGMKVVLTSVGNTIPANTPVILYTEEGLDATTLYGKPVKGTPVAGVLTGVYELTVVPANSYLLQNQEGVVGFYNVGDEKTFHVGANRCYLTADSGVKAYFFNEEADAINAVVAENGKEMFDLQGRKVMNAQKGIFIQNGKKVVK